ncbi:MAG: DUF3089 domain-containing protein [Phaeodactylibacter sp.]|nr:DUF3089 domain-containing protein [Phaeodactylibacter sp.]MCB9272632.1 DUF3089 domain-containing protein [Lewinellaceae bacterium]
MNRSFALPGLVLLTALAFQSCSVSPKGAYSAETRPSPPDYSRDEYWAALPWKDDAADRCPDGLRNLQDSAAVDVFFLYPTRYVGRKGQKGWNAPLQDAEFNKEVQESTMQFQASLFNGVGRIFSPYHRQAHLNAYFTRDTASARQAFELAYGDVRAAFQYYLAHYNQGRPIVLAAHSQGTTHAARLIKEFFDGKPLQDQLVVAYIIGIPVGKDAFEHIRPCQDSLDTGCYNSWRTFRRGTRPRQPEPDVLVTNPLLWTSSTDYAGPELNLGAVLHPFEQLRPGATDAQVHGPILWAKKPRFPGSFLLIRRNYHAGDFNLYYLNVRENAQARVKAFLKEK